MARPPIPPKSVSPADQRIGMGPLSSVSSISFTGCHSLEDARWRILYQRHTQPGTLENQRQGETEEENGDDEGDGDDNESRRCSD